jgi:CRISPR-associated protein Cst2
MAFVTGLILVDAPASALNNAGADEGARTENAVATKLIRAGGRAYPYVSAQAFRFWLRTTLQRENGDWQAAPIFREAKVAYTDGNPLSWWDDDLFGYMRAQSKRADAAQRRAADQSRAGETETRADITRVSPFRASTLVSIAPVVLTADFGTMSRHDGDPVPHEHQFYRTVLKGLISLDLHAAGTFSYRNRTGYRNLDDVRKEAAEAQGLEHLADQQSYRLPISQRVERVRALVEGLGVLDGGAKQAIHYTDVTPAVILAMVTRGGNNPLQYVLGADSAGLPRVQLDALTEVVQVWGDQILSPLYVGWVQGFHDPERTRLSEALSSLSTGVTVADGQPAVTLPRGYVVGHPRTVLQQLSADLAEHGVEWMA